MTDRDLVAILAAILWAGTYAGAGEADSFADAIGSARALLDEMGRLARERDESRRSPRG
jgi:hypothetical protein